MIDLEAVRAPVPEGTPVWVSTSRGYSIRPFGGGFLLCCVVHGPLDIFPTIAEAQDLVKELTGSRIIWARRVA